LPDKDRAVVTKKTVLAGPVLVTSFCRRSTRKVADVTRGTQDTEHIIEVENGSTLPYDVEIRTVLPDSPPINAGGDPTLQFARGALALAVNWTATILRLQGSETRAEAATVHCVAAGAGAVRVESTPIKYRLGRGLDWQSENPSQLSITVKII
jgi:hypothetical protein